jgi:hypothetical protein
VADGEVGQVRVSMHKKYAKAADCLAKQIRTHDVQLASVILPATTPQAKKHMLFLHGLLGRGKNWTSIAQDVKAYPHIVII